MVRAYRRPKLIDVSEVCGFLGSSAHRAPRCREVQGLKRHLAIRRAGTHDGDHAAYVQRTRRFRSTRVSDRRAAPERLLTYAQTAEWLNVSKRTVERLVKRRELVPLRVGCEPRLDPAEVRAYLENSRRRGGSSGSTEPSRIAALRARSTPFADRVRSKP
jgi:excisionase family DNA binding protein